MKRLLLATTSAAVLIGMSGAASAQSVLERVLSQTNAIQDVTGIFANTADNIGTGQEAVQTPLVIEEGVQFLVDDGEAGAVLVFFDEEGDLVRADGGTLALAGPQPGIGQQLLRNPDGTLAVADIADPEAELAFDTTFIDGIGTIDGSISIDLRELSGVNATIENELNAIEAVTAAIGNMSTTVLGAVNTGEIALGSNIVVEEAVAGTSEAVRGTITQLGSQTDQTVMALNSALNTMNIDGSIDVTMQGVNATIGRSGFETTLDGTTIGELAGMDADAISALVGGLSTTAIGAVNTGEITSGVNGQVTGTVSSIVGNSAANVD